MLKTNYGVDNATLANISYAADDDALKLMHWMPRLGEDNILMAFRKGVGELTKFHRQVIEAAQDLSARLVIIDTAADTFGGNENDRGQVRQFVQHALGQIVLKIDGAVLCCAHPSRTGLSTGSGDSGSTGWSNAFRSRAFLNRPEDDEEQDTNARILTRKKANFASIGDTIKLQWRNGVIIPNNPATPNCFRKPVETIFLSLLETLIAQGRDVSPKPSPSYAPTVFEKHPNAEGFTKKAFAREMERLLVTGRIHVETIGPPSRQYKRLVITPPEGAL